MKAPDFIEATLPVECIEIMCVAGGKVACFQITAAQIFVAKSLRALAREKMKAQPAAISSRDALGFSKKCDKQKENQISIDLRL